MLLLNMFNTIDQNIAYNAVKMLHPNQWDFNCNQRRSQDADKVSHIKGRLLDQERILFNCVPFQMGTSLKGKMERIISFLRIPYSMEKKTLLSH